MKKRAKSFVNISYKQTAIIDYSAYLKQNHRFMRGWSLKRIKQYVNRYIYSKGWHSGPQWVLDALPDVMYDGMELMAWDSVAGFYRGIRRRRNGGLC